MHALTHARTPADWQAISRNVMHSGLGTADEICGILKDDEIASRIARMGANAAPAAEAISQGEILAQIQALMAQLQTWQGSHHLGIGASPDLAIARSCIERQFCLY